ncbi:hypothetical protein JTB14_018168 [Gonioctena quinquepunctata]|nr:hypothetical protein JTB14_018168 [Gonioctena quinquepunctata]
MYPDLETYRRNSDVDKTQELKCSSYLEKNCNQIFVKGPALTRDILEKVNADIVPYKTYLLGYEMKTRRFLLIAGLCLLFLSSSIGTVILGFTDAFDNFVLSQSVMTNNSDSFKMWKNPTPKALYSIYIFNYTNVNEYQDGVERKLNVQEVGPYTYEENIERVNVQFIDEERISYQEKRSYKFLPNLSMGKQLDQVTVPNIPLISGSSIMKEQHIMARLAFSVTLKALDLHPFINLPADDFLLGYHDRLYELSKMLPSLQNAKSPEKFALLSAKIGLNPRVITMNTGKNDMNKLGTFEKIDGEKKSDHYGSDSCNSVTGGDGSVYPPKKVQQKEPLHFMFPDIYDIFDTPEKNPDNQCYCNAEGKCPLRGLFNTTACTFGSPTFISHPHFNRADPKLLNDITGLNPENRNSSNFMNLHPTMGFMMTARSALQMNIQINKAYGVSQMDMFEDGIILPISWIDVSLREENLPQDFVDIIYFVTFTVNTVKMASKIGCLLTSLITFICLVLVLWRRANGSSSCRHVRVESIIEEN